MLRSRSLAFVIGCAMLASRGSDSGSTTPPTTGGGGGTGGGTPPAGPTYQTFAELTGTQTFITTCGGSYFEPGRSPLPVGGAPLGAGITIVSDRSQPSYNVASDGTGLFAPFETSFTQADRDASVSGEAYRKNTPNGFTERFSIFPITQNSAELPYVRVSQVVAENFSGYTNQTCALGVPTLATDRPSTSVTYSGLATFGTAQVVRNAGAGPVESYRISASTVSLTGNPTNGQIGFSLTLKGQLLTNGQASSTITDLGTFTGTTTFANVQGYPLGYSDLIVNANNTTSGTFGGGFFGPQGGTAAVSVGIQTRRADDSDLLLGALFIMRPQ